MVRIQLSEEQLLIDGTGVADEHARAAPLSAFTEILGPHSRVTEGASEIFTWDHLGLCLYRDLFSRNTLSLTIYLARRERANDFNPESSFAGEVEIDGRRLGKGWGAARLGAAGFTSNRILKYLWSSDLGPYDLTLETDREVSKVANLDIGFSGESSIEVRAKGSAGS